MATSKTHSAAVLQGVGSNLVIEERPTPSPGPGEVLLRNHAIGLNPIEWKVQSYPNPMIAPPVILGTDVSGVVAEVGPDVTTVKPGDRVFGIGLAFLTGNRDHAGHQEYSILRASAVVPLPEKFNFTQGAALPTAVLTATMMLFDGLGLSQDAATNAGKSILIWGGASSVGAMTVQFARRFGLTVYTTASERHHARLRELGASAVVDYNLPTAVDDLISAADSAGTPISFALDVISAPDTLASVTQILHKSSAATKKLAITSPPTGGGEMPEGIEVKFVNGAEIGGRREDLLTWLCRDVLPEWLESGGIVPQAQRVIDGGVGKIQDGLDVLKKGVSAEKVVVKF